MTTSTKRDFGSFHVSNVQDLITAVEDKYVPPEIPEEVIKTSTSIIGDIKFGRTVRDNHFYIRDCTFLNHGAFGGVLKPALQAAQVWQTYIEGQPLRFFDRELLPHLVYVTRRMAKFVGCEPEDLVLVQNVTTALNSILKSLQLKNDDIIFSLSIEYGAVKKMLKELSKNTGAIHQEEVVEIPVSSTQQILKIFEEKLKPETKLVIFDHIPSNTPFKMPVKEISAICRKRCPHAFVIVDGAHALLSVPLSISELNVDYYVSNCHKWFSAPKGTAFMYVKKEYQSRTHPLVISHGWGSGFNSEFIWQGLRDYSGFLALHTVIDFWTSIGLESVRKYMHTLAKTAADMLVREWNSTKMAPDEMNGCMICVQLPRDLYKGSDEGTYSKAETIQNILYHRYNIEVPIKAVQGDLHVRISAHIYNEIEEYKELASAILTLTEERVLHNKSGD